MRIYGSRSHQPDLHVWTNWKRSVLTSNVSRIPVLLIDEGQYMTRDALKLIHAASLANCEKFLVKQLG